MQLYKAQTVSGAQYFNNEEAARSALRDSGVDVSDANNNFIERMPEGYRPERLTDLLNFTGTENYYRHGLFGFRGNPMTYTDGVAYLAAAHSAYWLLDVVFSHVIAIYNNHLIPADQKQLLVCRLSVHDDNSASFVVEDGNDNVLAKQEIEYTDFPAKTQQIWVQNGVAMLPSEY